MKESSKVMAGFRRRRNRVWLVTLLLALTSLTLCVTMLMSGNTFYNLKTVAAVLLGSDIKGASFAIGTIRLPRMLAALLSGLAFGMAGNAFQTMLRNPLASPDIIGVTSGSSIAAVFCMLVLRMSGASVSFISVVTGLAVAVVLYLLSKGGSFSGGRLILIGIGIQAMIGAGISYLLLKANQYDVPSAMRWLSGSLNGMQMKHIPVLAIAVLTGGILLTALGKHLKILELSEQSAITLGVKTDKVRLLIVTGAVCLIAFATSVTGPIAFIAFLSGPISARLVGSGRGTVLAAGLTGAILVMLADLIGQFAFSVRFPVGVITGILGAPYLLFLLIRMNQRGGTA